jgi:hypothetical protein
MRKAADPQLKQVWGLTNAVMWNGVPYFSENDRQYHLQYMSKMGSGMLSSTELCPGKSVGPKDTNLSRKPQRHHEHTVVSASFLPQAQLVEPCFSPEPRTLIIRPFNNQIMNVSAGPRKLTGVLGPLQNRVLYLYPPVPGRPTECHDRFCRRPAKQAERAPHAFPTVGAGDDSEEGEAPREGTGGLGTAAPGELRPQSRR